MIKSLELHLFSGEVVTDFTALAEKQTERFTGIPINKAITEKELALRSGECRREKAEKICAQVKKLNQTALRLLDGLICFKERILKGVLDCEMFTLNYPLLIERILREAKLSRHHLMLREL